MKDCVLYKHESFIQYLKQFKKNLLFSEIENLQVEKGSITHESFSVTWSMLTSADEYEILVHPFHGLDSDKQHDMKTFRSKANKFEAANLKSNTLYTFRVQAMGRGEYLPHIGSTTARTS